MEKKKKAVAKKETVKKEVVKSNEVVVKNQPDYTEVLNRILYALVIIGVLLALNLCVNLIANSNKNNDTKKETTTTEENTDYDVSEFETLTTTKAIEKIEAGGTQVVYIGRATCGWCVKFVPIMKEVQNNLKFKHIYINLEEMSDSDADALMAYDSFIEENLGSTPMILIFKDGEYATGTAGYMEVADYTSFLNEAGIK